MSGSIGRRFGKFCGERSNQRRLADAVEEYKTGRTLSARSLGKVLQFRADRLVNGMRLRKIQTGGKHAQYWQVEIIEGV